MSIPYTYLLKWSTLNMSYYGVRYSNKCSPSDLWSPYKSSSKHVKKFIELYGEPDIITVRRTFKTKDQAQKWESTILRRLRVREKSNWLNVNPGSVGFFSKSGKDHFCYGKKRSEESNKKQSITRLERVDRYSFNNHTPEQLDKVRQLGKNNARPKEQRTYTCTKCSIVIEKIEYSHHPINENYRCKHCKPGRPPKPVIMFGVKYDGESHAATVLRMSLDQIRHRLGSEKFPDCTRLQS